jgi:vanillin dehydrogenase
LFEAHLHINGRPVPSPAGATYDRRDPVSDRVVTRAAAGSEDDALAAADAAAGAFAAWSGTAPGARAAILKTADGIFAARADDVVAIAANELGSSEDWTRFNVDIARQILRQAATLCDGIGEAAVAGGPPGLGYRLSRRPGGRGAGHRALERARHAGRARRRRTARLRQHGGAEGVGTVPAHPCPGRRRAARRGRAAGALGLVTHARHEAEAVVEALIGHPAVRRVNFTGSTRVGHRIAAEARGTSSRSFWNCPARRR